ncbi:uncharacterized protein LOC104650434 [Saimiri boliviensis]|uniref:uncharacterized protein LOC104650434 n=1 Tax=Saimiri boliviensis TaxID=27679 RepID=UPI003D77FD71
MTLRRMALNPAIMVSSDDQASTVGLRSWEGEEDLEEQSLYVVPVFPLKCDSVDCFFILLFPVLRVFPTAFCEQNVFSGLHVLGIFVEGPRAGLCCACCRQKVVPCCESETRSVAAAGPASTTAEPAMSYPRVVDVQYLRRINSERRKGLAGRAKSWAKKKWKPKKTCRTESEAPVDHPEDFTLGSEEEEVASDMEKPAAQYHHPPVEVLQDLVLEDVEEEELPSVLEKPAAQYHHRPVEVLQDLVLEDVEEEELPSVLEKSVAQYHHRPVEVLQDLVLEDVEEEELPSVLEKPEAQYHHPPVDHPEECPFGSEEEEVASDMNTAAAPSDHPPPEDSRSTTSENDDEFSEVIKRLTEWTLENLNSEEDAFPVSTVDQASTVGLRSWEGEEDLEEQSLYKLSQERVKSWLLGSDFRLTEDDPQGTCSDC